MSDNLVLCRRCRKGYIYFDGSALRCTICRKEPLAPDAIEEQLDVLRHERDAAVSVLNDFLQERALDHELGVLVRLLAETRHVLNEALYDIAVGVPIAQVQLRLHYLRCAFDALEVPSHHTRVRPLRELVPGKTPETLVHQAGGDGLSVCGVPFRSVPGGFVDCPDCAVRLGTTRR